MTNRFIIAGNQPLALIDCCLAELAEHSKEIQDRLGEHSFILVPEALKADIERRYLKNYDVNGLMLAEVVSFKRFAHRIFSIAGGLTDQVLSPLGKTLVIQKIIYDHPDQFKRFQRFIGKPGYTMELEKVLADFKKYDLNRDVLENLVNLAPPSLTKDKLQDFLTLKTLYEAELTERLLKDDQDDLDRLADLLISNTKEIQFLRQTRIWISGYADIRTFNQQELRIIQLLSEIVKQLKITVYANPLSKNYLERELFEPGHQSYQQLRDILPNFELQILPDQLSSGQKALQEAFLTNRIRIDEKTCRNQGFAQIQLIKAEDSVQEWAFIAGEIKRLIREEHYRRKDIGIAYCDEAGEIHLAKTMFREFSIPTYLTERLPVQQSPLYHCLEYFLQLSNGDFRFPQILSFLRSGFSEATFEEIDQFENICLQYGLHYSLKTEQIRQQVKDEESRIWLLQFKEKYLEPVFTVAQEIRQKRKAAEKANILLRLLATDSFRQLVSQKMTTLREEGEDEVALSLARTWEIILQALEEMHNIFDNQSISQKAFGDILLGALSGQIPSSIPIGLDKVRIGSIKDMMYYDCKVLFITGTGQANFPAGQAQEGFLKKIELDWIEAQSKKCLPDYQANQIISSQVSSVALFATKREKLYLSTPSFDISQWANIFRLLHQELADQSAIAENIQISSVSLGDPIFPDQRWLTEQRAARYFKANQQMKALQENMQKKQNQWFFSKQRTQKSCLEKDITYWGLALPVLENQISIKDPLVSIRPIIFLNSDLKKAALQNRYSISASSLENYQRCPYQYFGSHLLHLRERPIWDIDQRDRGTFIHAMMETALREFSQKLLYAVSVAEQDQVFANWFEQIQGLDFYRDLYQKSIELSGVNSYGDLITYAQYGKRIKRHVRAALLFNAKLLADQQFIPTYFEWKFPFSDENQASSDSYQDIWLSSDEIKWKLRGLIDRIDIKDNEYRIYDYKTGEKYVDFNKIYYGLDLQLGLYQKVWQINHPEQQIDAMGYLTFNNKLEPNKNSLFPPESTLLNRLQRQKLFKQIKADKNELNANELNAIGDHAFKKSKEVVAKIKSGDISPRPQTMDLKDVACTYCPYAEMCRMDKRLLARRADILQPVESAAQKQDDATNMKPAILAKPAEILDLIIQENDL